MLVDQQACAGADGAARPAFDRQPDGLPGRDGGRRQFHDDRPPPAVEGQRVLHRLAFVDADADRFHVVDRALDVKVRVAEVVEAHGADDAVFGQGEIEIEGHALILEEHPLERQLQFGRFAGWVVIEQRRAAGDVVVDPRRRGDTGHRLTIDAGIGDGPEKAGDENEGSQEDDGCSPSDE